MTRYSLLTACLLAVTALSAGSPLGNIPVFAEDPPPPPPPPPPPGMKDVAQILYEVKHGLSRQEIIIKKTHKALLKAHEAYVLEPGAETYATLLNSAKADAEAVTIYSDLVSKSAKLEEELEGAEKYFEGETPLTKEKMETGPQGKSVASEKEKSKKTIEKDLVDEAKHQPRGSDFTKQLQEQAKALKPLVNEKPNKNDPVIKNNSTAKKEDDEWFLAVKKSVQARDELQNKLFKICKSQNPDDWEDHCCSPGTDIPDCKEEQLKK